MPTGAPTGPAADFANSRALADCTGLLVAKIGDGPKKRLQDAGIEAVDDYAYGATEDSIKTWYQKRLAHHAG